MTCFARTSAVLVFLLVAGPATGDIVAPPPESPDGADYEAELADSLEEGSLEMSFSASGRPGVAPRRSRRVRFSDDSLAGSLRQGSGDPLSGGVVEGRNTRGSFGIGRLAPRWGRGLLMGSPAEPWELAASDRGERSAYRGRAGEGAWFGGGGAVPYQLLYGRFGRRRLAGFSTRFAGIGVGAMGSRAHGAQASAWLDRDLGGAEAVIDRSGRWRADGFWARPVGDVSVGGRARAGHARFVSIAEPQRSGPAQALTLWLSGGATREFHALGSLWRFRSGFGGARAAIKTERRMAGSGRIAFGVEEQRGVRRTSRSGSDRFRQGWWCEWRGGTRSPRLGIRHEAWGSRRLARDPVRVATTVRVEIEGPGDARLRVTHSVFRVKSGESLYLREAQSDRIVLRALTGAGQRTRIEVETRASGGSVEAAVDLSVRGGRPSAVQWTLGWKKRARWKHGR